MSNRDRIHQSPIHRRRGPTHTHDYPDKSGKKRRAEEGVVSPHYGVGDVSWDEEGKALQTDRGYGSGSNFEDPGPEQHRYTNLGRNNRGISDLSRRSYWDDEEDEPRPRNNYDDDTSVYPPTRH